MSHVSLDHRARATDHAIRWYAERILGLDLEGLDDPTALSRVHARECEAVRRHLGRLGGVILLAGMRTSVVVVPDDRLDRRAVPRFAWSGFRSRR